MKYNMEIRSYETENVYNQELKCFFDIEVGSEYIYRPSKLTTKKDRKNNGRIVEVLGFSSDFFGDAIVRYKDNNRRGRLNPCCLVPYK
jgi:hypothetical protein